MQDLAAEALDAGRPHLAAPDTGTFEGDLTKTAAEFLTQYSTPLARQAVVEILRASIQKDPTAQTWASRYGSPRLQDFRPVFTRAVERGELSANADIETMMFVLSSTLLQASLLSATAGIIPADAIERVISVLVRAGAPPEQRD